MDLYLRDSEIRQTAIIAVIKGDNPEALYEASAKPEDNIGDYIERVLETQKRENSVSVYMETLEFARDIYEDGIEPVATLIELVEEQAKEEKDGQQAGNGNGGQSMGQGGGNQGGSGGSQEGEETPKKKLVIQGFAVFKNNRLVGYMDATEARAYNFITNRLKNAIVTIPFENGEHTVVQVKNSNAAIKVDMNEGKTDIDLNIKTEMIILQETNIKNINENEVLKTIEERFNELIRNEIVQTLEKSQKEFQADSYGFGLYAHIQNPREFEKVNHDWNSSFADANINVTVESMARNTGAIKQPFKLEF